MTDETEVWEQPGFENGLDAVAVDLITAHIQQIFADLDPLQLVEADGLDLSPEDKKAVADLIDHATVELEIDFSGEGDHPHEH
ncbi:MAG: hypothetical protein IT193_08865 [Propionibacteriaceae bacterium]|nr:hypothetical protein [Propionibacteriaceae bacterium]